MAIFYVSAKDAARERGVSVATWWRWARQGRIPAGKKLGPGTTRWKVSELEQWEAGCREVGDER